MSKWWHVLISGALAVVSTIFPAFIAGHPALAGVLASIWAILGQILPSPIVPTTTKNVSGSGFSVHP
jgi:hypothetical protein